jgi:hypothetical protein
VPKLRRQLRVFPKKGQEVQRAISAKDVKWQAQLEEFAKQVAKLSKAGCLDAESIAEVKTRIQQSAL